MGRMGRFRFKELIELQKKFERMQPPEEFLELCTNELAARLLRMVTKATPTGDYSNSYVLEDDGENKFLVMSAKEGGTLKRAWTAGEIRKEGTNYVIDIINPTEYASYVEYGHRQQPGRYVPAIDACLKKGWVPGHFMMTISEKELKRIAPNILERRIKEYLEEIVK